MTPKMATIQSSWMSTKVYLKTTSKMLQVGITKIKTTTCLSVGLIQFVLMKGEEMDIVIVLAHIDPQGNDGELQMIYNAIRKAKPELPIVLLSGIN